MSILVSLSLDLCHVIPVSLFIPLSHYIHVSKSTPISLFMPFQCLNLSHTHPFRKISAGGFTRSRKEDFYHEIRREVYAHTHSNKINS